MVREGFIRPRGAGSVSHLPRRKIEQNAPAPVLTTQKERDERMTALLNETLKEQHKHTDLHDTQGEQAKPARDEEVSG